MRPYFEKIEPVQDLSLILEKSFPLIKSSENSEWLRSIDGEAVHFNILPLIRSSNEKTGQMIFAGFINGRPAVVISEGEDLVLTRERVFNVVGLLSEKLQKGISSLEIQQLFKRSCEPSLVANFNFRRRESLVMGVVSDEIIKEEKVWVFNYAILGGGGFLTCFNIAKNKGYSFYISIPDWDNNSQDIDCGSRIYHTGDLIVLGSPGLVRIYEKLGKEMTRMIARREERSGFMLGRFHDKNQSRRLAKAFEVRGGITAGVIELLKY